MPRQPGHTATKCLEAGRLRADRPRRNDGRVGIRYAGGLPLAISPPTTYLVIVMFPLKVVISRRELPSM
jgi:hypothetical protein